MDEIQTHSKPVIERCYREFLERSADPEEREYPDPADQIREVLIHANYMSQRDIDICFGFDVESLKDHEGVDQIRALHRALVTEYKTDVTSGAA